MWAERQLKRNARVLPRRAPGVLGNRSDSEEAPKRLHRETGLAQDAAKRPQLQGLGAIGNGDRPLRNVWINEQVVAAGGAIDHEAAALQCSDRLLAGDPVEAGS